MPVHTASLCYLWTVRFMQKRNALLRCHLRKCHWNVNLKLQYRILSGFFFFYCKLVGVQLLTLWLLCILLCTLGLRSAIMCETMLLQNVVLPYGCCYLGGSMPKTLITFPLCLHTTDKSRSWCNNVISVAQ